MNPLTELITYTCLRWICGKHSSLVRNITMVRIANSGGNSIVSYNKFTCINDTTIGHVTPCVTAVNPIGCLKFNSGGNKKSGDIY